VVKELWEQARPLALDRLNAIDDAVAGVMSGTLDGDVRARAQSEAHKLAGSLGTFGLREATERAAALEIAFEQIPPIEKAPQLAEHSVELRRLVEAGEAGGPVAHPQRAPDVVAVGLPVEDAMALISAGEARGLAVAAAGDPDAATSAPVALLACHFDGLPEIVERLSNAGVTVALALNPEREHDRVELVRRGARRMLPGDASPDALVDALGALTEISRPPVGRILVLDDDPTILLVMEAILGGAGYEVTVLEDPLAVWAALERTRPDLMVCDVSMPGSTGSTSAARCAPTRAGRASRCCS
jgi:CheY-like chemotaxis protein